MLEAFVGPCPDGMECCHEDGNPGNNALSNLRWGTTRDNQADRVRHGTSNRGERCGTSKLTAEEVRAIRREYAEGWNTMVAVAKKYGVSQSSIFLIVHRKNWAHVE